MRQSNSSHFATSLFLWVFLSVRGWKLLTARATPWRLVRGQHVSSARVFARETPETTFFQETPVQSVSFISRDYFLPRRHFSAPFAFRRASAVCTCSNDRHSSASFSLMCTLFASLSKLCQSALRRCLSGASDMTKSHTLQISVVV